MKHRDTLFSIVTRVLAGQLRNQERFFLLSDLVYRLWKATGLTTTVVLLHPVSDAYKTKCIVCRHT
jgi:hypothetical protein